MIFGVWGIQVENKNRTKFDEKMNSTWEGILASIFQGLQSFLGPKLARKLRGKSSQDKPRQGKTKEGKGRERKGRERQGLERKKCPGEFLRPGGGVHPPFRGRPPQGSGPLGSRRVRISYSHLVAILVPSIFPSFFQCLFGSILAPFSMPTCLQKSTKIN